MTKTWNYLLIEGKRSSKLIINSILSLVLLVLVTVCGILGIHTWMEKSQSYDQIRVGIGMDEDDETTELLARLVAGMDSVKTACTFSYITVEEAEQLVSTEDIDVAILLPKNFYEDVDTGVNTPVSVLFASHCTFNTEIFAELLGDGVSLVQITESAVYAATDIGREHKMTMRQAAMQEYLSMIYLEAAYGRGRSFDECVLSPTGEVNLKQYYIVVGMLFFLLMAGSIFAFFYQKKNKAAEEKLRFIGLGPVRQSAVKIGLMSFYIYLAELLMLFAGLKIFEKTKWVRLEFEPIFLLALFVLALSIAGFFHGIYGIFGDKGSLGLIIINAIMFICTGGFVPTVYFPKWIQALGQVLPLAYWMEFVQKLFFGKAYDFRYLPLLLIGLIFAGVGTVRKCVRI